MGRLVSKCSRQYSRPPDSCLVLPKLTGKYCRATPTECFPCFGNPCHPRSTPLPDRASAWSATHPAAPAPASLRRPIGHPPPKGATTGGCDEHVWGQARRHRLGHLLALPLATTIPCSSSSPACAGGVPRGLGQALRYMPRSASAVAWRRKGVIPQKHSTPNCSFLTHKLVPRPSELFLNASGRACPPLTPRPW